VQEDGTFRIERVPPGRYLVSVGESQGAYIKEIIAGGANVLATGLDLSQQQTAPVLEIMLSTKAATVQGVAMRDGKPWPNASVTLAPEPLTPAKRLFLKGGRADREGRFTIRGIAPGDYKLYAWEESISLAGVSSAALQPYEQDAVSLRLAESETKQAEVQVAPPR
jgi:hypothetical protein